MNPDAYLARLQLPREPPSPTALKRLHRAHVERIPYEAIEIQLGNPTTVDPYESAARILDRHRGGYCYHLNGAFSLLLDALGYDVVWHRAGVQNHSDPEPVGAQRANHLALTVHGLADADSPSGDWLVDVGLGDALHEPLPLHAGTYTQGPLTFELGLSTTDPGGWRLEHDPKGSFAGMDFRAARATQEDFRARHDWLSTAPESGFVRTFAVQRRDTHGVDVLRGCVLTRVAAGAPPPQTLETKHEWFDALATTFDLPLGDLTQDARTRLWTRVRRTHDEWLSTSGTSATP
jgi:N-hydroxyarylamine O-acetyltransferase